MIESDTYGLRFENGYVIGDTPVLYRKNKVTLQGKDFVVTDGLHELLVKRIPQHYTAEDLAIYKDILILTNAHKKQYNPTSRINANSSWKYKNIISVLFPPRRRRNHKSVKSFTRPTANQQIAPVEYPICTSIRADESVKPSDDTYRFNNFYSGSREEQISDENSEDDQESDNTTLEYDEENYIDTDYVDINLLVDNLRHLIRNNGSYKNICVIIQTLKKLGVIA